MFASIIGNRVYVRLSRQNLRQLEAILAKPGPDRRYLTRADENGVALVVQVEDDRAHYAGRDRDPGPGSGTPAP